MLEYFIALLYFLSIDFQIIIAQSDIVTQGKQWPIDVTDNTTFTFYKRFSEKSELCIEILNIIDTEKCIKISKSLYAEISNEYYVIKKGIKKNQEYFQIKLQFFKKSHENDLVFYWLPDGVNQENTANMKDSQNMIYKSKISLRKKWEIKLSVEIMETKNNETVYFVEEKYFQHGKKVKITCNAFDGLPSGQVYVNGIFHNRFSDTALDKILNKWIGYLTLRISDHNTNVSCHVGGTDDFTSHQFKVNHPPTSLTLEPEYTGYIKNGSKIRCLSYDGYPPPIIKWDFVSVKNHSNPKALYQINDNVLIISADIQFGTQIEFNCSAIYTNPMQGALEFIKKNFRFEVGEKSDNIEKLNKAAIGAGVAGIVIMIIAVSIVVMLCRSKPKQAHSSTHRQEGSPKYSGSLLAGSKSALHNQMKSQNGASSTFLQAETNVNSEPVEFNYDDYSRGRRPIKVVDDPVVYSTIVGTMQPKMRPSLDLGPIDRV